jgi:hypothetical protein
MTVYPAQHTEFFLEFDQTHDAYGAWTKAVAEAEPLGPSKVLTKIEVGDWTFRQNGPEAPLWYVANDNSVLTSVPADLTEFLRTTPAALPLSRWPTSRPAASAYR